MAQAEPPPKAGPPAQSQTAQPKTVPGQQAQAPVKGGRVPLGGACRSDNDCKSGTYCDNRTCVKVTYPFHIPPYLFYRSYDGRFTEILGIYWHQRGTKGYQVVFPFYWHYWSPQDETRLVLPFYYGYYSPDEGIRSTFYTLFQFRRTPNERNYRLWPLLFWTDYGERGAGLTVFPLFHFAREGTRTAAVLPFLLSGFDRDPERDYSRGLVLGLYYWHKQGQKQARTDAVFPLFYAHRSPQRSAVWVLPFNFYLRNGEDRTLLLLPFFAQRRSPARTTTVSLIPPLYHHREGNSSRLFALPLIYHSRDGERSFFLGGPFYWHKNSHASGFGLFPLLFTKQGQLTSHQVVFPLFWRFRSVYHNFTLAGPVFYHRDRHSTTTGVVPLFYHHRDRKAGQGFTTLFPLFYYGTSEHGRRTTFISPLVLYERDDAARVKQWGLLAPPFYHRRDEDREVDALIPLGMRWHDKVDNATTWVVGPTVWYSDPEGDTQVFFPLFWRFTDTSSGAATAILFPLGYRHRRPDGSHTNLLLPFYYRRDTDGWSASLLPVLFLGSHEGGARRHAVLFPALWHIKTKRSTTTVMGPLYLRTKKTGWHAGLAPLLFAGSDDGDRYGVMFPALWYHASAKEGHSTVVAGPAFYSSGRKGRVFGLLPLFAAGTWKGTRFQTVLPPLFYHASNEKEQRSFTLAGPYLGWRKGDERGHAVIPVAYYKKTAQRTLAFAVPLFYYRNQTRDRMLVTPLGGFRTDKQSGRTDAVVGPVVWHKSPGTRGFAVVPFLYHWRRDKDHARTTVLFPLGVHHSSTREKALVVFPVLWHYASKRQKTLVLFPLFLHHRTWGPKPAEDDFSASVLFPIWWRLQQPGKRLTVLGPFIRARSNDWHTTALLPLFLHRRSPRGTSLAALPFIFYRSDHEKKTSTLVVGPLYHRGYAKGSATGLIPVFFRKDTPTSRYTVLAPVYWDWGDPAKRTRTVIAGPLFYHRNKDRRSLGLAPLLYTAWDKAGGRSLAIFPLFYQRSEPARFALYTPLGGYDRSIERTQWYVGPFFRRRSAESTLDIGFPLFVRHRNHVEGRTTLVMPLYYGRWSNRRSFHLGFPIFWSQRRIDSSATVVFPLVWDFNDRFASRTTIVFPAVLYHRNHATRTTSVFTPPGLWLRFRPKGTDAVLFPVLWHFGGTKRRSTVIFPLYWDFKRGGNRRYISVFPLYWDFNTPKARHTMLLPLFYNYDSPTERKLWVLNTYYRKNKVKDTYGLYVFPLFFSQRKRPGDLKLEFLLGLFGYERIGRNRLMTLLFFTFPLDPLPAKAGAAPPRQAGSGATPPQQAKRPPPRQSRPPTKGK